MGTREDAWACCRCALEIDNVNIKHISEKGEHLKGNAARSFVVRTKHRVATHRVFRWVLHEPDRRSEGATLARADSGHRESDRSRAARRLNPCLLRAAGAIV